MSNRRKRTLRVKANDHPSLWKRCSDLDPICLLIQVVAVEICTLYIVHRWMQFKACGRAKPEAAWIGTEMGPQRTKSARAMPESAIGMIICSCNVISDYKVMDRWW